jgi:epsilon-lactone hydrolase
LRAAVEDAVAAYHWLLAAGHDPASVAIAGDSTGGGPSLATLVALRDASDRLPAAAMSPWTDLALAGASLRTRAGAEVLLTQAGMPQTAALYCPAPTRGTRMPRRCMPICTACPR